MQNLKRKKKRKEILLVFLTIMVMVAFFYPIFVAVITSFKENREISQSVMALPQTLYIENYRIAAEKSDFIRSLLNTCIVTFPSVVLIVFCGAMGGYAIARNSERHRGFRLMDRLYLASLMIPFQIMMIPVYKIYKNLHLQNSLFGMILILTGTSVAYATFLYVGFVKSIPRELEEAAKLDGCGPYQTFFRVVFPLLKPVTVTVAALHVMWLWNDFNIALIILQKDEVRTLTVKQYYFFGQYTAEYGMAFASAILSMIPVLIFFLSAQRYLVEGVSAGAVKS
ncbi:MAG TPA: carbohydrate ABC transporter permease [Candidatus Limivivens intestinipullorum]|uniref:Carbohydrate ABC transporter permease n=1 Tax=Candidatus Limivivens intestinipullorum TaxID=2840858 RepID=A0A9D1JJ67_9FIRM|nr:carbohydrate ABC transporter permease [Candidatus Limivivens intestinipullorum]